MCRFGYVFMCGFVCVGLSLSARVGLGLCVCGFEYVCVHVGLYVCVSAYGFILIVYRSGGGRKPPS